MQTLSSPIPFFIHAEHRDGIVRVLLRGEIDMATVPLFEQALATVEELQPAAIILDFDGITFMDSTGLHALVRAHGRASRSECVLAVVNGAEGVRKVFELTSTDHLFEPAVLPDVSGPLGEWSPLTLPGVDGG